MSDKKIQEHADESNTIKDPETWTTGDEPMTGAQKSYLSTLSEEAKEFLKTYQSKAVAAGVDALGYYLPPFGYAYMQVLQQAVEGANSLDQEKLADQMRKTTFKTVVGDIKFGPGGEWVEARVLTVQFQGVKSNDLEQFRNPKTEVILGPAHLKTGDVIYPYADARK